MRVSGGGLFSTILIPGLPDPAQENRKSNKVAKTQIATKKLAKRQTQHFIFNRLDWPLQSYKHPILQRTYYEAFTNGCCESEPIVVVWYCFALQLTFAGQVGTNRERCVWSKWQLSNCGHKKENAPALGHARFIITWNPSPQKIDAEITPHKKMQKRKSMRVQSGERATTQQLLWLAEIVFWGGRTNRHSRHRNIT